MWIYFNLLYYTGHKARSRERFGHGLKLTSKLLKKKGLSLHNIQVLIRGQFTTSALQLVTKTIKSI
jgi:hypothetical protein